MQIYTILQEDYLKTHTKDDVINKCLSFPIGDDIKINTIYYNLALKRKQEYSKLSFEEIRNYIPKEYRLSGDIMKVEVLR